MDDLHDVCGNTSCEVVYAVTSPPKEAGHSYKASYWSYLLNTQQFPTERITSCIFTVKCTSTPCLAITTQQYKDCKTKHYICTPSSKWNYLLKHPVYCQWLLTQKELD